MQKRLGELNALMAAGNFWNNHEKAHALIDEANSLRNKIEPLAEAEKQLDDLRVMVDLGEAELLEAQPKILQELEADLKRFFQKLDSLELKVFLSGPHDRKNCILSINAGAGGTEAQDWAEMIARMYQRWAESRGWEIEVTDALSGEGAGLKSITMLIQGENAYGFAKAERGVHRLVRISPFDSAARRHTSFASVWVYPVVDDRINIEINEADCRIDTYRSQGAGGQHINTTDSAIRITHMPSGIVVACQAERSQHKTRATAWNMLRARLYEKELERREAEANAMQASRTEIGWGHQIRSYVLQPYQLVKDLRTGHTSGTPSEVLDGELDDFMQASLAQRVYGGGPEKVEDVE